MSLVANKHVSSLPREVMLSVFAVSVAILVTTLDVFGEKTNIHFASMSVLEPFTVRYGLPVNFGGSCDASKLSRIVG